MSHEAPRLPSDAWQQLEQRTVYNTPFMDVREDTVQLPDGKVIDDYSVVSLPDGVLIVATDEDNKLIMFNEYKYAANKEILGFPAGGINKDELPTEAAARELLEETGYTSVELTEVGALDVYPSKIVHTNHVVRAKNARRVKDPEHEATESIGEVQLINLEDIAQMQRDGYFRTTYLLAALALTLPDYLNRP